MEEVNLLPQCFRWRHAKIATCIFVCDVSSCRMNYYFAMIMRISVESILVRGLRSVPLVAVESQIKWMCRKVKMSSPLNYFARFSCFIFLIKLKSITIFSHQSWIKSGLYDFVYPITFIDLLLSCKRTPNLWVSLWQLWTLTSYRYHNSAAHTMRAYRRYLLRHNVFALMLFFFLIFLLIFHLCKPN